jgi:ribonuclease D
MQALEDARALPDEQLPPQAGPLGDGIPPTSRWADRQPEAVARLTRCRLVVNEIAESRTVLVQNLLASDVLRRLTWEPPATADPSAVAERLRELGARPWQVALTAPALAAALA